MAYSCTHATMRAFHSCTHETLLIYHTLKGFLRSLVVLKGGAASLHSERQLKPSVSYLSDRDISFQNHIVAQRIGRVAKQLYLDVSTSAGHLKDQGSFKISGLAVDPV